MVFTFVKKSFAVGPIENAPWPESFRPPNGTWAWLAVP
jgi:hypothetical protein